MSDMFGNPDCLVLKILFTYPIFRSDRLVVNSHDTGISQSHSQNVVCTQFI